MISLPPSWSEPLDLYCERLDPSYWAEPLNAVSNAAFIIAAVLALRLWLRSPREPAVGVLTGIVFLIGLGSYAFHTWATRGAMLLDIVPIGLFIYGYMLWALRRLIGLRWLSALAIWAAFVALSLSLARVVPREFLNGSSGYLPALVALFAIGAWVRVTPSGRDLLTAGVVFVFSIMFRVADPAVCAVNPYGTHFLWHILNAVTLYLALRAAIGAPAVSRRS